MDEGRPPLNQGGSDVVEALDSPTLKDNNIKILKKKVHQDNIIF